MMYQLPRLTGFIRAVGEVSGTGHLPVEDPSLGGRHHSQRVSHVTWKEIWEKVQKNKQDEDPDLEEALLNLQKSSRQIAGQDSSKEIVDDTKAYLFELFHDVSIVGQKETGYLRRTFGPFPASAASVACSAVNRVVSCLSDVDVEMLSPQEGDGAATIEEFGSILKFTGSNVAFEEEYVSDSSDSDEEEDSRQIDMKYSTDKQVGGSTQTLDTMWLQREVTKFFPNEDMVLGMSYTDLCATIFDFLTSNKTDEALQNDLFELLGFDRFELIQSLLEHRTQVVSVTFDKAAHVMLKKASLSGKEEMSQARPTYGCQVTIQSVNEKQLQKQFRKEEKKMAKLDGKVSEQESNYLKSIGFNPHELRAHREASLRDAASSGLFSSSRSSYQEQPKYPFVFDQLKEAQQTSSYVSGTKMLLPMGFERVNEKEYEEVTIPPNDPAPANIGKKLLPITILDEIGQLAFRNTKSLNRIQSVVFDAAYTTNQNLLICAPTGAGKTNIAMLTILHEINQHITQGVIKKDEFKVIYVAPMKALAAEMVRNFGKRLEPLGISVKELTGDMQLSKMEILKTQMLVTTPEKWDVVTRKSTGDVALSQLVKLLIIDEVHLLHDDRGAVIESLVARTLRQVESSQSMIRIVGLSATLPNYEDVAQFLHVNNYLGLFFFDGRFRPVPLGMTFIGIKSTNRMQQMQDMNNVCYDKVLNQIRKGYQVMVFVHARNETVRTAMVLRETAKNNGEILQFAPPVEPKTGEALKAVSRSRNKQLKELLPDGFAIHHAGMLRSDRNLVEKYFSNGVIKVLVCTATLAWGVNLPAHAVIIKGTQIYDAKRGSFVDLGILDVLQIFGRAGRPQYDTFGHGTIITSHDKLPHYLSLMTRQNPIESQFVSRLTDNLNAEIALGTVTNVEEAVKWLRYTYMFTRMKRNPLVYGLTYKQLQDDPMLEIHLKDLIVLAGRKLDKAKMVRFDERTMYLNSTDLGRIASHFYITYDTVEIINERLKPIMSEQDVFSTVSRSSEFEQIKVREEEMHELDELLSDTCVLNVDGGTENTYGKVNILLQSYIRRKFLDSFSLTSDQAYVAQNSARVMRALFEMTLKKGWPVMASRLLTLSKVLDKRQWDFETPLRQFSVLSAEILHKIEQKNLTVQKLKDMDTKEIGHMIFHVRMGSVVKKCVNQLPNVNLEANIQPITRSVLRVRLTIMADFQWEDKVHGKTGEPFWIWVEDPENHHIYHSEYFMMQKKHVVGEEAQQLIFTIPIFEPLPSQYYMKAVSDRWLGCDTVCPISFQHLILPERHPPHTELLDLQPLPITALDNPQLEALYDKFTHFNPVQTQIFHTLYHSSCNVLLGAPTGSGKTVAAELAIFRVFREYPKAKCVYIAPLKALVRERMEDWKVRIEQRLGKKVVELTGDVTPDMRAIGEADLIVTTPEKWDGVSRSWQTRSYVKSVVLLVIDEIHLLGDERGPVLEVIVSRTNFISSHTEKPVRVVGLSTALANARDLADWLGIKQMGLFNFRPSVRPVPLDVHISGFSGKHYCPRMATMNKPCYQAILTHSSQKPVLIFVSSRRQTRLTALDLIAFLAADDDPKHWLHMPEIEMEDIINGTKETNLRLTLAFGIGIHHAGLEERDRKTVEELFVNQKIQILVATSTLAWGVNFPAHLVIIKGTEFFDGKQKRYVDFPITDVLQMMGRAGRPQFDDKGVAVVFVHDIKKHFYRKFMYEPFPVESNLLDVLADHLNAEIVAGTISSKQDAMDYLTWTYFFRRLVMNPSYYDLNGTDHDSINLFLSKLVEQALFTLEQSYCVEIGEDKREVCAVTLGRISSYYYLNHLTLRMFHDELKPECSIADLVEILSNAHEYADLPVRHNEDQTNSDLAKDLPLPVSPHSFDSSSTKAHLLLQAHFSQVQLPSTDYQTDTKSVLDQAIRICQAMLDVSGEQGWLVTALQVIHLVQMILQGRWIHQSSLLTLPHVTTCHLHCFSPPVDRIKGSGTGLIESLPELLAVCDDRFDVLTAMLENDMSRLQINQLYTVLCRLPQIDANLTIKGWWAMGQKEEIKPVYIQHKGAVRSDSDWTQVHADQEYVLHIDLYRLNKTKQRESKAHTPKFPKNKDEGWFMVLGEIESKEVVALKRVGYVHNKTSVRMAFYTPEHEGRVIYTLYIMSDCYIGVDQQYDICLEVIGADIESQVNTEVGQQVRTKVL